MTTDDIIRIVKAATVSVDVRDGERVFMISEGVLTKTPEGREVLRLLGGDTPRPIGIRFAFDIFREDEQ